MVYIKAFGWFMESRMSSYLKENIFSKKKKIKKLGFNAINIHRCCNFSGGLNTENYFAFLFLHTGIR